MSGTVQETEAYVYWIQLVIKINVYIKLFLVRKQLNPIVSSWIFFIIIVYIISYQVSKYLKIKFSDNIF